jgi:hypothetical protein
MVIIDPVSRKECGFCFEDNLFLTPMRFNMILMRLIPLYVLLALMILAPSQGQCENWKEYFKDGSTVWQYDKDSIHYPHLKKTIFGLTARNKEIVNVWQRQIDKKSGKIGDSSLMTIYCATRVWEYSSSCREQRSFFISRSRPARQRSVV